MNSLTSKKKDDDASSSDTGSSSSSSSSSDSSSGTSSSSSGSSSSSEASSDSENESKTEPKNAALKSKEDKDKKGTTHSSVIDSKKNTNNDKSASTVRTNEKLTPSTKVSEKSHSKTNDKTSAKTDETAKSTPSFKLNEKSKSSLKGNEKSTSSLKLNEKSTSSLKLNEKSTSSIKPREKPIKITDKPSSIRKADEKLSLFRKSDEKLSSKSNEKQSLNKVTEKSSAKTNEKLSLSNKTSEKSSSSNKINEKLNSTVKLNGKSSSSSSSKVNEKLPSKSNDKQATTVKTNEKTPSPSAKTNEKSSSSTKSNEKLTPPKINDKSPPSIKTTEKSKTSEKISPVSKLNGKPATSTKVSPNELETKETVKPNVIRRPTIRPKASATLPAAPRLIPQKSMSSYMKPKSNNNRFSSSGSWGKGRSGKSSARSSEESDSKPGKKSVTPPPPKLTPIRNIPMKKMPLKPRRNASASVKKSPSSSNGSKSSSQSSSGSSSSDSEHSTKSGKQPKRRAKNSIPTLTAPLLKNSAEYSSSNNRISKYKKFRRDSITSNKKYNFHSSSESSSDSDSDSNTPSDSDTSGSSIRSYILTAYDMSNSNSGKKTFDKSIVTHRKGKETLLPESKQLALIELVERTCPIEGCDSTGHLNGIMESHFTPEACPIYHNLTMIQCQENLLERNKRHEKVNKIVESSSLIERLKYKDYVEDARAKIVPAPPLTAEEMEKKSNNVSIDSLDKKPQRELDFTKFNISQYDVTLFREAQAISCEKVEEELKQLPNVRGTKFIEIGKHQMEVWYQSPYPEEYTQVPKLYICSFCLRYMKTKSVYNRHAMKCVWKHPPGDEVYRKDRISVWEVDGKRYKTYSQNLCLLAKFFLDHKTLYHDVEPFLFYIMTETHNDGCHVVGYFSKEKNSFLNFNVSCILTLPAYQRQGFGRLLIEFSYLLTRVEGKVGSPEKPLSDLGLISYRSYWKEVLLKKLCELGDSKQISIKDMSKELAVCTHDIVSTLQVLGMIKYWKGKHIVLKRKDIIEDYKNTVKNRPSARREIDARSLRWHPPSHNNNNHHVNSSIF